MLDALEHELELRSELIRLDRDRAETLKLVAEAERFHTEALFVWHRISLKYWFLGSVIGGVLAGGGMVCGIIMGKNL